MVVGIFQDTHANLPAFRKAIEVFRKYRCKKIYHIGDLIGIGPHPNEVFQLTKSIPELICIMGNHDYWYAYGLPNPQPPWMSDDEIEHQKWTHHQIGEEGRSIAGTWKFVEELDIGGHNRITFLHYGYDEETKWFDKIIKIPDADNLDKMFTGIESELIFYGHNHESSDITGTARYVNLGSAGCYDRPEVRLGILEINNGEWNLEKFCEPYNDHGLLEDFELRKVPARAFITKTFITR